MAKFLTIGHKYVISVENIIGINVRDDTSQAFITYQYGPIMTVKTPKGLQQSNFYEYVHLLKSHQ